MKPNEFRLFVSSTFRDLMPERDQLVKKVFPRVRAAARERGVEFTEIDLRWGITDEETRTGKVLRICVEEIGKCRPYFMGIMGSRYGYTPGPESVELDPALFEEHAWLHKYVISGKSISEIEFLHGAILPHNTEHAFIYDQLNKTNVTESDDLNLQLLKEEVAKAKIPLRDFSSPEEFGEMVLADLLSILEHDHPISRKASELDLARQAHEAYALNRRRSYVADPHYLAKFEAHIISDTQPLVLWGKSGLGKSSMVAYLLSAYRDEHPEAFVIEHYVGAGSSASDSSDVMRHIMLEIKERYQLTDEIPTNEAAMLEEFPAWLAKVNGEKLILAIDALNQLPGVGAELHWLPDFIPAQVRLIVSATPGISLDALIKREWNMLELAPLDEAMRERITLEYLLRFRKVLTAEKLARITKDEKTSSPLFLRTVLEELRIYGGHTTLGDKIEHYLSSNDESDLFHKVLMRMESDHGEGTVRKVMSCIWASRNGLSENELLEIVGLTRLQLSTFLIALEYHLMQRGGLYTFFHNYLREAVEIRYLSTEESKKEIHRHLASYFSEGTYDSRRRDEEPWQWQAAEDTQAFKDCITDIPMLEMLLDESRLQEIIGYWVELQKNFDLAATYHSAMEDFKAKCEDEAYFAELSGKLGNALVSASHYKEAEYHLRGALNVRKKLFGEENAKTAQSMNDLATLCYNTGDFSEAESFLQSTIRIRENTLDKNDPTIAKSLNDLGAIFFSQGKLDEAEECFSDALKRYETYFKSCHSETASTLSNLGAISYFNKEYNHAIDYFNQSIRMYEQLYGSNNIAILFPLSNLALAYTENRDYNKAEDLFLRTLHLTKSIYGDFHDALSNVYLNFGVFYSKIKEYRKAIDIHKNALEINKCLLGEEHYLTINSYLSIGMNLYRNGEFNEGKKLIEHYLPLQKEKLGPNHQMYKVQEDAWNELIKS